ncbi:MAG TPA: VLRF1 family aeRF1-type release factor [Solirubrobacterales bacterium]|nr:VLRF1 family aeRF1-type release factor [Solirubrobacterales bacterium]
MAHPTFDDARRLGDWQPPLGVVSVYLAFDPADRGGAWRTELRNGLDALLDAAKDAEHERRVALRAVARRISERFEDGDHRPPPRGAAGFVEVAEKGGEEHWWGTGAAPAASACVELGERPALAPLVDLACRGERRGVAIVSLEQVRLLEFAEGELSEIEHWELEVTSLDWRERKVRTGGDPSGGRSGPSGKDEYGDRLDHNRHKFLGEAGALVGRALAERGIGRALAFGPANDLESFEAGLQAPNLKLAVGGEADLISTPLGKLRETVAEAVENADAERESRLVAAALEEARGGSRGATGLQEVAEVVAAGRVERLVLAADLGGADAESLVRGALAGGAKITVVHGPAAEALGAAEGAAAILRY